MRPLPHIVPFAIIAMLTIGNSFGAADQSPDLWKLEEQSIQSAVTTIAPSVVRIDTLGGRERVGEVVLNVGPTSGVIVDADGHIISSAFNFIQEPTSVLVTLSNGDRKPARIVARDHSRMLVLLKIDADTSISVPNVAPLAELRVGQWAIAVGRTISADAPNIATGILSAKQRIWNKAIQTDANVSPANYGGALVDIHGRAVGVLVPLSPDSSDVIAGAEWYDSGIGFAVPMETILQHLPRLKLGDLHPGKLGIAFKDNDLYGGEAIVAVSRPNSPARIAGIEAGDKITGLNGTPVRRQVDLKHVLGPLLAGETIELQVTRNDTTFSTKASLVEELVPYEHAFLGLLPVRSILGLPNDRVAIRFIYPESPLAKAGLQAGDQLVEVNGKRILDSQSLRAVLAGLEPNTSAALRYVRGDNSNAIAGADGDTGGQNDVDDNVEEAASEAANKDAGEVQRAPRTESSASDVISQGTLVAVTLQSLPSGSTPELPLPYPSVAKLDEGLPQLGKLTIKLPEEAGECFAYIPQSYDVRFEHALLVLLPIPGKQLADDVIKAWQSDCDATRTILLMPRAKDPRSWLPTETAFIRKTIENLRTTYRIDGERITIHGEENSGAMAFLTAFTYRDLIRGVSVVDAPVPNRAPPIYNEPLQRLAVFIATTSSKDAEGLSERIAENVKQLRESKFPVTERVRRATGDLDESERGELLRWIDSLDRI